MNKEKLMRLQVLIALKTGHITASKNPELIALMTNNGNIDTKSILSSSEVDLNTSIIPVFENIKTKIDLEKIEEKEVSEKRKRKLEISEKLNIDISTLPKEKLSANEDLYLIKELDKIERELQQFDSLVKSKDDNNIIQTNYNIWSSPSGRITSYSPCLQNLPSYYKDYYLPLEEGHEIYELDIISAEIIALAHLSKEYKIFDLLAKQEDIYSFIAKEVFNISPKKIPHDIRKMLKAITNGIFLGMGGDSIAKRINSEPFVTKKINKERGYDIKKIIFDIFPNIKKFLEEVKNKSTLKTYLGHEFKVKQSYKNLSFPAQNLVATILKSTLYLLEEEGLSKYIVNIIHDSLIISVPNNEVKTRIKDIFKESTECMLPENFENSCIQMIRETKLGGKN